MLKNWLFYYFFLLVSLVFALMYPGRTSSAFFYALVLAPLLSLGLSALILAGFRFEQYLSASAAVKGDSVLYSFRARNRLPLLLPSAEFEFYGAGGAFGDEPAARSMHIPPFGRAVIEIRLSCRYKGVYDVGVRQIRFRDYLGLFTFRQNVDRLTAITVYPRIVPADGFPVLPAGAEDAGTASARNFEQTGTVSDIRKYSSGDRLRSVHWKLSAKRGEMMVRNYERTSGAFLEVILDASGAGGGVAGADVEDRIVECALSIANLCRTGGFPGALCYFSGGRFARQGLDADGFQLAYRQLAETDLRRAPEIPDIAAVASEGGTGKTVAVVTASLTPELAAQSEWLMGRGCRVVIVHAVGGPVQGGPAAGGIEDLIRASGAVLVSVGPHEDLRAALARAAA